jgi:hypothetical protein
MATCSYVIIYMRCSHYSYVAGGCRWSGISHGVRSVDGDFPASSILWQAIILLFFSIIFLFRVSMRILRLQWSVVLPWDSDSYAARRWAEYPFGLAVGVRSNADTTAWVVVVRLWLYSGFGETILKFNSNYMGRCMAAMMLMFVRLYVCACVHMRSCVHYQLFYYFTTIHMNLLVHYILLVAGIFTAGECMFASLRQTWMIFTVQLSWCARIYRLQATIYYYYPNQLGVSCGYKLLGYRGGMMTVLFTVVHKISLTAVDVEWCSDSLGSGKAAAESSEE